LYNAQLKIFAGTANQPLAKEIAKYLKVEVGKLSISHFKDGEVYVRIDENVRGTDVFVIQPTSKDVNYHLMELSIIIDSLKRASASRITAVMPYYGYARQDRKAKSREPITAKLVANLLTAAGADRVLTLDLHSGQIQGFFDIPLDNLTGATLLANYISDKKIRDLVMVSPDAGGVKNARVLAKIFDAPLAIIDKRREKHNQVEEMRVIGEVKGKNCVILDDMIDTGGTILAAAKALKNYGAEDVYIAATHGVLSEPAVERLTDNSIKEVILTNTIDHSKDNLPSKIKVISVGYLLGEAIKRIHEDRSISALFEETLKKTNRRLSKYLVGR
jgi:ribose-phosphate pyrophosphokinase